MNLKINKLNLTANHVAYIIALSAVFLSLIYAFAIKPPLNVDAKAHNRIAINLAEGNGYWEKIPIDKEFDRAIGRSGPLIEYFLAGIYKVFGVKIWVVWIIHALIRGLTVILIYKLCLLVFNNSAKEKIGLMTALIFGWYPDLIESSVSLMTETTYLFLFVLVLYIFYKYIYKPNLKNLIIFSAVFALLFLAKSIVLMSALPIFLLYFLWHKRFKHLILSLVIMTVLISPWVIRNYIVFDKIIPSRIYGFYTLHVGNYHGASGENDIVLLTDAKEIEKQSGVFALEEYSKQQFFSFVKEHPIEYVMLHFRRFSIYFSWLRPAGHWPYLSYQMRLLTYISSGIFSVILFAFGLSGLFYAYKKFKDDQKIKLLIYLTLLTPLPFILTQVETRFRYLIYPLLAIFAGYCLILLSQQCKKNILLKKIIITTVAILSINTLFDLYINFDRFISKLIS